MQYNYTKSDFNLSVLHKEIASSAIGQNFVGASSLGTEITVKYTTALDQAQKTQLDSLIAAHSPSSFDYQFEVSRENQEAAIEYGSRVIKDWMRKNSLEGISIVQSLWVFSRLEEISVGFPFGTKHVDIFKMLQGGALASSYYCLLAVAPDDMTQPYHWVTSDRLNWMKQELAIYLGPGQVNYIEGLFSQYNP